MLRLVLILIVLLLAMAGAMAVALNHFFGWKGLIAFPFLLVVMVWLGKAVAGAVFKRVALGLFSVKASVLRGASLDVQSIVPVPKPPEEEGPDMAGEIEGEADHGDAEKQEEDEEPEHFFAVDMTISPKEGMQDRVWEPGELILTSEQVQRVQDLEDGDKDVGHVVEVLVWNGSDFGPDEECKYPGVRRLRVTFAVKPGISQVWLQYYSEGLGSLELPPWRPQVEPMAD